MRSSSPSELFTDIEAPLTRALALIRPHYEEINVAWRQKLRMAGLGEAETETLGPLTLEASREHLEATDFDAYWRELQRLAAAFEGQGLIEAHAVVALGLYLECCLPYLFAAGAKGQEPAIALARIVTTAQSILLCGYASNRSAAFRRLQQQERHNLSRNLHDDIGHNLLVLKLYLEIMAMDLKKGDVSDLEAKLEEAQALVSYAVDSVRRLMLDLGPAMLSRFGFLRALRIYARQFTLRTGIEVTVEESGLPEKLPTGQEIALYRVLQGALSNVLQHSHAKKTEIHIGATGKVLVMTIEDDGIGFDVAATFSQKAFGVMAMRERVELLGGRFHIASLPARPGSRRHGTRIEIDLPLR